jgi:hypothetical protein
LVSKINYCSVTIASWAIKLTETVSIPLPLLKELYEHFGRIEEILAPLEELSDKKGLRRIEKSLEEYKKKDYAIVESPEKIRQALVKD